MGAGTLIAELKRRRVLRALVGYGIAAFAVLQIIEPIMHGLHWPDEVLSYVVVALAAGFPVVVALAWIFDVNEGRIERTAPAPPGGLGGARLAVLLVSIGALAAAPGTIWYFLVRTRAGANAGHPPAGASIAVLPFSDLSPQHDQEYLAEGLTVELLSALAQVPKLHVAGRVSSFSFKEKNTSIGQIGGELHVSSVLQGSVQKAGDRVRITAQLINVADGFHLWAQTFDRQLNDIFAVEAEIARAVTATLKVMLKVDARQPWAEEPNLPPEAREHLLLGWYILEHGSGDADARRAQEEFEEGVALAPRSATAHAALSETVWSRATANPDASARATATRRALAEADTAVRLDGRSSSALQARGYVRMALFDWEGAGSDLERAFAIAPGDAGVLQVRALLLETIGKLREALELSEAGTSLEPLDAALWARYGAELLAAGRLDRARSAFERSMELRPLQSWAAPFFLGTLELQEGHLDKALSAYQKCTSGGFRLAGVSMVKSAAGQARDSQAALDELIEKYAGIDAYQVVWVYAHRGDFDQAFQWLDRAHDQGDSGLWRLKWDPLLGKLRGDPRYTAMLKKMNLPLD